MTDPRSCQRCGARVPTGGGMQGMCPRCLMELAEFDPEEAPGAHRPPPEPEELAPVFPRLSIERLIGRGGMGAVYEARQPELDRKIALKVLPAELARDPNFAERFEREAQILARLDHPSIVRVHDAGLAGDWFYLAMDFVDGVDLRRLMEGGELSPRQALAIVGELCDALQYAHDQGVVHRDIKPENVLIDRKGHVKVADFGLAKLVGGPRDAFQLTRSDQAMGTLHYMAPEQLEKPRAVDHRADIYSLGVLLYELLTGELPIGRFPNPSQSSGVDARLDEVVLKTLEKQPERRYQQASEVKTAVNLAQEPLGVEQAGAASAGRGGFMARHCVRNHGERRGRPHSPFAWLLGCGCLIVVGLLLLGLLFAGATHRRATAARDEAVLLQDEANANAHAQRAAAVHAQPGPLILETTSGAGLPEVSAFGSDWLALSESERLELDAALQAAQAAYLVLEARYAEKESFSDKHVVWTIAAFPERRAALLSDLREDLLIALGLDRATRLMDSETRTGWKAVAPYGHARVELSIRKRGAKYEIRETDFGGEGSSGQAVSERFYEMPLPARYRRFEP